MTTVEKIEQWAIDRNLHTQDPKVQMCKTMEELGELAKAIYKGDKEKQMDGIGDTVVTLICMAEQLGLKFNDCIDYAYNEIKDRKGKLINGTFVKESDPIKLPKRRERRSARAKLTQEQVHEMRAKAEAGVKSKNIAEEYGVTPAYARAVIVGDARPDSSRGYFGNAK